MSAESQAGAARVRASDAEREEFARIVREAVGEGRLTLDEGDERLATIYAARFRDELDPLTADLPEGLHAQSAGDPAGVARRGHRTRYRSGPDWWRGERDAVPASQRWPARGSGGRPEWPGPRGWPYRRGLARHVGFVAVVTLVLVGLWAVSGAHFFWPAIPLAFLAIGLLRRFR